MKSITKMILIAAVATSVFIYPTLSFSASNSSKKTQKQEIKVPQNGSTVSASKKVDTKKSADKKPSSTDNKKPDSSKKSDKKSAPANDKKTVSPKNSDKKSAPANDKKTLSSKNSDKKSTPANDKKTVSPKNSDKKSSTANDKKTLSSKNSDKKSTPANDKKTLSSKNSGKKSTPANDKKTDVKKNTDKKSASPNKNVDSKNPSDKKTDIAAPSNQKHTKKGPENEGNIQNSYNFNDIMPRENLGNPSKADYTTNSFESPFWAFCPLRKLKIWDIRHELFNPCAIYQILHFAPKPMPSIATCPYKTLHFTPNTDLALNFNN